MPVECRANHSQPITGCTREWCWILHMVSASDVAKHKNTVLSPCSFSHLTFCCWFPPTLTQPMDPEKKSLNFIFPTQYVIPKSLKFGHWLSENHTVMRSASARLFFLVWTFFIEWTCLGGEGPAQWLKRDRLGMFGGFTYPLKMLRCHVMSCTSTVTIACSIKTHW